MEIFLGTLLIVIACCIAMGLGLILSGKPLPGGCGTQMPADTGCAACPKRGTKKVCHRAAETTEEAGREPC